MSEDDGLKAMEEDNEEQPTRGDRAMTPTKSAFMWPFM
jgi:hypothetical protein